MFFAAEGQLDFHPMPKAETTELYAECHLTSFTGRRHSAWAWIARPGQGAYFLVTDSKMTSGDDITEAAYFIRPYEEYRGWVVRSLWSRKLVVTRNVYAARDANTWHAQLALSDDLVGLDMAPGVYRESAVRRLFATCLDLPASTALVVDDPFSGVPIALVPALGADQGHVVIPESAWSTKNNEHLNNEHLNT